MRAYLELLRLPNVFTAMADILLGFFLTHESPQPWFLLGLLIASSSCLYLSGMVLNDWFDRAIDARERPERPIPSGRVRADVASRLGLSLLALGIICGWATSLLVRDWRAGVVATLLAAAVLAYNAFLKSTIAGPLMMGSCRMLNVLLGMSATQVQWAKAYWVLAAALGLYIVGVTWFARTEARRSSRPRLATGLLVILAGLGLWASFPTWMDPDLLQGPPRRWQLFAMVITALIGWRCLRAVIDPRPQLVQLAVKNCIVSIIVLDAGACLAVKDPYEAMLILVLILPTMLAGRWIYST